MRRPIGSSGAAVSVRGAPSHSSSTSDSAAGVRPGSCVSVHASASRRHSLSPAARATRSTSSRLAPSAASRARPRPSAAAISSRPASVTRWGLSSATVSAAVCRSVVLMCDSGGIELVSSRWSASRPSAASRPSSDPVTRHPPRASEVLDWPAPRAHRARRHGARIEIVTRGDVPAAQRRAVGLAEIRRVEDRRQRVGQRALACARVPRRGPRAGWRTDRLGGRLEHGVQRGAALTLPYHAEAADARRRSGPRGRHALPTARWGGRASPRRPARRRCRTGHREQQAVLDRIGRVGGRGRRAGRKVTAQPRRDPRAVGVGNLPRPR